MTQDPASSDVASIAYDFVVVRLVPHVHRYGATEVGVILHARTAGFLDARMQVDPSQLQLVLPEGDPARIARYLETLTAIARGEPEGGELALLPPSERFHWLAAPRSDIIQCSPIHGGLSRDPARTLNELFEIHANSN